MFECNVQNAASPGTLSFAQGRRLGAPGSPPYRPAAVAPKRPLGPSTLASGQRDGRYVGTAALCHPAAPRGTQQHPMAPRSTPLGTDGRNACGSRSGFPRQLTKKRRRFLNRFAGGRGLNSKAKALPRAIPGLTPGLGLSSHPTNKPEDARQGQAAARRTASPPKLWLCPPVFSEAADGCTYCTGGCE